MAKKTTKKPSGEKKRVVPKGIKTVWWIMSMGMPYLPIRGDDPDLYENPVLSCRRLMSDDGLVALVPLDGRYQITELVPVAGGRKKT